MDSSVTPDLYLPLSLLPDDVEGSMTDSVLAELVQAIHEKKEKFCKNDLLFEFSCLLRFDFTVLDFFDEEPFFDCLLELLFFVGVRRIAMFEDIFEVYIIFRKTITCEGVNIDIGCDYSFTNINKIEDEDGDKLIEQNENEKLYFQVRCIDFPQGDRRFAQRRGLTQNR